MLDMRIDSMVNVLVEQFLIKGNHQKNAAMHFHLDCRMACYNYANTDRRNYSASRGLHLIYYCVPGFRSVSVFSGILSSPFGKVGEVKDWKHESSHDSCWKTDVRAFTQVYFDMADEINEKLGNSGHDKVAPADMSENNNFALFGNAFDWKRVEIVKDPSDERGYRKLLTLK